MFRGKHVVITGGSSGLGLGLARSLVREGASVTLIARDPARLEAAATTIRGESPGAVVRVESLDVSDEARTASAMKRVADTAGGIDVLVNSAGILREGYFEKTSMATFREVMEVNFFGLVHATRGALPALKTSRGRLVNIASFAGLSGAFGYTAYCSSKHALVGLTDSLRYELQPQGIRVHVVCPAEFDTPMVDALEKNRTPENRAQVLTIPKTDVETIVQGTLAGVRAGRYMIVPGTFARTAALLARHMPGVLRANSDRVIRKVYRGPSP